MGIVRNGDNKGPFVVSILWKACSAFDMTSAECEVAVASCQGQTVKAMAHAMGKSDKTIQQQRRAAFRKTKALCVEQLVLTVHTKAVELWLQSRESA